MKVVKIPKVIMSMLKDTFKYRGTKTECCNKNGISRTTINRAIKEGNCSEGTYEKLISYTSRIINMPSAKTKIHEGRK